MMNNRKIGKITDAERNYIMATNNRKISLEELILTVYEKLQPNLYKKINNDLSNTIIEYDNWWQEMQKKYQWKEKDNGYWIIDFSTCDIMINEECNKCN